MTTAVAWVDARDRLPGDGMPVAAAITGRYPAESSDTAGEEFWLVMPMYFTTRHRSADGTEHRDCFVDSDDLVRFPYGRSGAEPVTHWAALPTLPGTTVHYVRGAEVQPALRNVRDKRPSA
ncbi:AQJ64_40280 family protein [Streptomyces sp. cg35]|uniref:AQJ64_40280 family protein n=1 Tax=Streptomyces sp. cg35 TaxID=3421650 RepID=UPI003D1704AE